MSDQPEMIRRVIATQATLNGFRDVPFAFGNRDCVIMSADHLERMGYEVSMPAKGSYDSPLSGMKALRSKGYKSLADALDKLGLPRIAPAAALPGDIMQGAAEDKLGGLCVVLGNGRMFGYHEHAVGATVMQYLAMDAAWRVTPK